MQVRNFFILLMFACFLLNSTETNAQKLTTNDKGEKIIVYPDGSWRYFDSNKEEDVKEVQDAMNPEEEELEDEIDKKTPKNKKSKSKKTKSKKAKKTKSSKSRKGKKSKAPVVDTEAEKVAKAEALRRADIAAAKEEAAMLAVEELVFKRIFLEDELAESYENVEMTHEDVAEIEEELELAKANEKEGKDAYKAASSYAKKMEKMIDMPKAKRDKALAKMEGIEPPKRKKKKTKKKKTEVVDNSLELREGYSTIADRNGRKLKPYNAGEDVMINPPKKECVMAFDDVDEFTGKRRKDVSKQLFFTYTPDRFKPYFKGRDYITCYGYLSQLSGGLTHLNLEFVIATEQAAREFGVLEMGSQLTIRGLDGERYLLQNKKTASGIANSLNKTTTYKARYIMDSKYEKLLRKTEVDKIRIIWGTGYEDYEVYEVDFLIDQFNCLRK